MVVVTLLLVVDLITGMIELIVNQNHNKRSWHWITELVANMIIALSIAFGSQRLRTQISRKQELIK